MLTAMAVLATSLMVAPGTQGGPSKPREVAQMTCVPGVGHTLLCRVGEHGTGQPLILWRPDVSANRPGPTAERPTRLREADVPTETHETLWTSSERWPEAPALIPTSFDRSR